MTYRWRTNPEITRQLGGLSQPDREDFFRVRERLEDDPRSEEAEVRRDPNGGEDEFLAPFGAGWVLLYRIDEGPRALAAKAILYRPLPQSF